MIDTENLCKKCYFKSCEKMASIIKPPKDEDEEKMAVFAIAQACYGPGTLEVTLDALRTERRREEADAVQEQILITVHKLVEGLKEAA